MQWWYLLLRPLSLLLITNPSRFSLKIANLTQEKPHCSCPKRVHLGFPTVLFVGRSKAAYESIEASPGLPERARARCRWVRDPKERACLVMDFGFSKLVEVSKEFKDMSTRTHGEWEWRPVVSQVLPKGVPISALLAFVPARNRR